MTDRIVVAALAACAFIAAMVTLTLIVVSYYD